MGHVREAGEGTTHVTRNATEVRKKRHQHARMRGIWISGIDVVFATYDMHVRAGACELGNCKRYIGRNLVMWYLLLSLTWLIEASSLFRILLMVASFCYFARTFKNNDSICPVSPTTRDISMIEIGWSSDSWNYVPADDDIWEAGIFVGTGLRYDRMRGVLSHFQFPAF